MDLVLSTTKCELIVDDSLLSSFNPVKVRVREYVFYAFFRFQKSMTFYVFFEMTYQKVVKYL